MISIPFLNEKLVDNLKIRAFMISKLPLLAILNPQIVSETDERFEMKIPLNYMSKNHLGSMYFAAMAAGADAAIGFPVFFQILKKNYKLHFLFKDFKATFLKRAEGGPVHFVCEEVQSIVALIEKANASKVRENQTFRAYAVVPKLGAEHVAEFELTLSIKAK